MDDVKAVVYGHCAWLCDVLQQHITYYKTTFFCSYSLDSYK